MNKNDLKEFINTKPYMVLSTINKAGKPESAVVGFGITDELQLVFGTSHSTRKANNVAHNENVAAVIGWDQEGTVQFEGSARMLRNDEIDLYTEFYFSKNESARAYRDDPDERYFLINPRWIRFTDVSVYPWKVTEFDFQN